MSISLVETPDNDGNNNNSHSKGIQRNSTSHEEIHINHSYAFPQQMEEYWSNIKSAGGDIAGEILVSVAWGERTQHNKQVTMTSTATTTTTHLAVISKTEKSSNVIMTELFESPSVLSPLRVRRDGIEMVSGSSSPLPTYEDEDVEDGKEKTQQQQSEVDSSGKGGIQNLATTAVAATLVNTNHYPKCSTKRQTISRNTTFICGDVSVSLNPLDAVVIIGAVKAANAMVHECRERRTAEPQGVCGRGNVGGSPLSRTLQFNQQVLQQGPRQDQDSLVSPQIWVRKIDRHNS